MWEKTEKKGPQQISTAGYRSKLDPFQDALLGLFILQKSEGAEEQTAVGLQPKETGCDKPFVNNCETGEG